MIFKLNLKKFLLYFLVLILIFFIDRITKIYIINLAAGRTAEVDFGHVHSKHLTITGSRMRPRSIQEKARICRSLEQVVWPLFESGSIRTETHAVFPFAEAADAHRLMESSNHIGKIILTP